MKYNSKSGKNVKYCYCYKCNDEVVRGMDHCDICDICIIDSDHHCNFFSKCIGTNNSCYFSGSIVMLILNFIIVAVLVCHDSYIKVYPNGKFAKMPASASDDFIAAMQKRNNKQLGIIDKNSVDDHTNEGGEEMQQLVYDGRVYNNLINKVAREGDIAEDNGLYFEDGEEDGDDIDDKDTGEDGDDAQGLGGLEEGLRDEDNGEGNEDDMQALIDQAESDTIPDEGTEDDEQQALVDQAE